MECDLQSPELRYFEVPPTIAADYQDLTQSQSFQ